MVLTPQPAISIFLARRQAATVAAKPAILFFQGPVPAQQEQQGATQNRLLEQAAQPHDRHQREKPAFIAEEARPGKKEQGRHVPG
ncbi:MAG: hypothetical protein ABSF60_12120, partial [Verrucomicrobiota bacterium]